MKKADLLQALSSKFYKIFPPNKVRDENGFGVYSIVVYDKKGESLRRLLLEFYIENEGQASEIAYWNSAEPKVPSVINFREEVENYVQVKIDVGIIEGAFVDDVDDKREIAYGRAIIDNAGTLLEKLIFVDKDGNGNLRHREIE